ncbi:MAG: queuosine precursor transporter, partial [Gammaproteobacteria bacterium]|nr:queuosine precursor transporter [Gammaproteobacteria bacterium]
MTEPALQEQRERVFLVLAGIFICAMTMLNILGITRFIQLGPLSLAIGVLPYPITFLCTDLICELYGRARANFVVTLGLGLNFFILGTLWIGNLIPSVAPEALPPWQVLQLAEAVALPNGSVVENSVELYQLIYATTTGAMFASMMAYIAAQYCDVQLFHFWKRVTKGKHLWVRNNFSTMISQLVDSFMVILVTFGAAYLAGDFTTRALLVLMFS